MLDEHAPFFETADIEQDIEPLARGQLAFAVLRLDPTLAAAQPRRLALFLKATKDLLHGSQIVRWAGAAIGTEGFSDNINAVAAPACACGSITGGGQNADRKRGAPSARVVCTEHVMLLSHLVSNADRSLRTSDAMTLIPDPRR
jgi:hypothetical protein